MFIPLGCKLPARNMKQRSFRLQVASLWHWKRPMTERAVWEGELQCLAEGKSDRFWRNGAKCSAIRLTNDADVKRQHLGNRVLYEYERDD